MVKCHQITGWILLMQDPEDVSECCLEDTKLKLVHYIGHEHLIEIHPKWGQARRESTLRRLISYLRRHIKKSLPSAAEAIMNRAH